MTIQELKKIEGYQFECNIEMIDVKEGDYYDQWGSAYIRCGWNQQYGTEYNLCIDYTAGQSENCSAIYMMGLNDKKDILETDYSTYIHYEIDFNNKNWKNDLENKMCEALISFYFEDKKMNKILVYDDFYYNWEFAFTNMRRDQLIYFYETLDKGLDCEEYLKKNNLVYEVFTNSEDSSSELLEIFKENADIKFSLDDLITNDDEEEIKLNIQEIEILSNLVINNIKNISETKKYFMTQNGIETADNEIKLLQELNSKLCLMMEK